MNRSRLIKRIETGLKDPNVISVTLSYNEGGMNYFNYRVEKRGLYIHVTPECITHHDGYITTKMTAFSGVKKFVKEMKRFSQKQLDSFEVTESDLNELIEYVKNKNGID